LHLRFFLFTFFLYKKELPEDVYNAPIVTAASAADGLTDQQMATAKVFDVAAGTGMCAEQVTGQI
jgi:hypothetical protein